MKGEIDIGTCVEVGKKVEGKIRNQEWEKNGMVKAGLWFRVPTFVDPESESGSGSGSRSRGNKMKKKCTYFHFMTKRYEIVQTTTIVDF
jgi:hypothetical protein